MFWNYPDYPGGYSLDLNNFITLLQSGDFSVAPWIFCVLSENHSASKMAAADSLCAALKKMSFYDLIRVDEQMRQTTSMEWRINWRGYAINSFFTPGMSEEARRAVIIFASFNSNGFIRERAVRMMKDYDNVLPFVILRLNDWVPQVRNAAGEVADHRLLHLSVGELTAALPFVEKLSHSRRKKDNTYIKRIHEMLISGNHEAELAEGLVSANIRTRRICINALFNKENPRHDLAAVHLKHETDPFLRSDIFRRLMSAKYELQPISERFLLDKYPLNRLLAFKYIRRRDQNQAVLTAKKFLLDKNVTVRERARYYLNKNAPGLDYRSYYKKHLNDCTTAAILGLGETGVAEDTADIEKYLESDHISVTRAAMTAVMCLDNKKYAATITNFLSDDRVGIVKTARNLIIKTAIPDYSKIMGIFRTTQYMNTKLKCFSILLTASKWQRLIFILDALEIDDNDMRVPAMVALDRWIESYNHSFAIATLAQIEKITESIHRLDRILTAETKRQLLFLLR